MKYYYLINEAQLSKLDQKLDYEPYQPIEVTGGYVVSSDEPIESWDEITKEQAQELITQRPGI